MKKEIKDAISFGLFVFFGMSGVYLSLAVLAWAFTLINKLLN